jgi:hypothetical protein
VSFLLIIFSFPYSRSPSHRGQCSASIDLITVTVTWRQPLLRYAGSRLTCLRVSPLDLPAISLRFSIQVSIAHVGIDSPVVRGVYVGIDATPPPTTPLHTLYTLCLFLIVSLHSCLDGRRVTWSASRRLAAIRGGVHHRKASCLQRTLPPRLSILACCLLVPAAPPFLPHLPSHTSFSSASVSFFFLVLVLHTCLFTDVGQLGPLHADWLPYGAVCTTAKLRACNAHCPRGCPYWRVASSCLPSQPCPSILLPTPCLPPLMFPSSSSHCSFTDVYAGYLVPSSPLPSPPTVTSRG